MPKESKKRIINYLENKEIILKKIEAENLTNISFDITNNTEFITDYKYNVTEVRNNVAMIELIANIGFTPKAIFDIKIELIGKFEFKEAIDEKVVRDNIKELVNFIAQEVSFITSFITDRMLKQPYVLPPVVE